MISLLVNWNVKRWQWDRHVDYCFNCHMWSGRWSLLPTSFVAL